MYFVKDFTDTSQVQAILKKHSNQFRNELKFVCEWCSEKKLSILGFSRHLKKCKTNVSVECSEVLLIFFCLNFC